MQKGNLEKANKVFKKKLVCIIGKVRKRKTKLGKKIGFPTCNLDIKDYVLAKPGVYAVKVKRRKVNSFIKELQI